MAVVVVVVVAPGLLGHHSLLEGGFPLLLQSRRTEMVQYMLGALFADS